MQDRATLELSGTQSIHLLPIPATVLSLDFYFDDLRVWSVDIRGGNGSSPKQVTIPAVIQPYLRGSTRLTVRNSATGEILESQDLRFSDSDDRVRIADEHDVPLAVNKWGRLARTLEQFTDTHQLILERTAELAGFLRARGLRPFIVGGTLLGAVRDGKLLPHDDDADLAYLSEHTDPTQIALEHFQLSEALKAAGYSIVQHGGAHMQLHFPSSDETPQYYIDIFAAFFTDDGCINQPFHVRGPMRQNQLLPFIDVQIGDFSFPAPADTNAWLTVNYDRDWRTPIPGYRLRTKPRTQRRFQNWFGSFNFKRDFWSDFYVDDRAEPSEAENSWEASAQWLYLSREKFQTSQLLELGSGQSSLSRRLRTASRRVVSSDYLPPDVLGDSEEYFHLNLLRLNSLQAPQTLGFEGSFDVVANHVLEQTSHFARHNALRLIRMSCASGGTPAITMFTVPDLGVSFRNPAKWHLDLAGLASEAAELGMKIVSAPIPASDEYSIRRQPVAVFFSLDHGGNSRATLGRGGAIAQGKAWLKAWLKNRDQFALMSTQLNSLERQLDHQRRELLAVAETAAIIDPDSPPAGARLPHTPITQHGKSNE